MFYKVISNGLSSDTTISLYIQMRVVLNNAMAISTDMSSGTLRDGSASWKYVFPSNTEDAENVNYASWTAGTNPDVTFTCGAAGSTVWT